MNVHIARLCQHPRGKPYRSRLLPFIEDIRRWRAEHVSYRQIALWIGECGLPITGGAVHGFVKARDEHRRRGQFTLPPASTAKPVGVNTEEKLTGLPLMDGDSELEAELTVRSIAKHVFIPGSFKNEPPDKEGLDFNDPADL